MPQTRLVEPYVKVTERIHNTPDLLDINGDCNIAGVIVAPSGPRLAYVAGPNDFLKKYTTDGEIPRNADITFINAYYMSFSAGLVICRAMNTTAVQGMYFKSVSQKEVRILINSVAEGLWGMRVMGTYYWSNNGNKSYDDFLDVISNLTDDEGNYRYDTDFIDSLRTYANSQVYCSDFSDLAAKINEALAVVTDATADYSESVGGILISGAEVTKQLVDLDDTKNVLVTTNVTESAADKKGFKAFPMLYKEGVALTETEYLGIDFGQAGFDGNWALTYGTMAYYHGAIDKSMYEDYSLKQVDDVDDIAASISGINGMAAKTLTAPDEETQLAIAESLGSYDPSVTYIQVNFSKGNRLFFGPDETKDPENHTTQGDITLLQAKNVAKSDFNDMTGPNGMLFAIYPDQPYDRNIYKVTFTPGPNELFYMTLFDGVNYNTYTASLFPDATDEVGANAFIENISALDPTFTILTNNEISEEDLLAATPKLTQVFAFGDSGLDLSSSKRIISKINALYALDDQEIYDIEYMAPFGETNLQFIKNYIYVGKKNYWFTPVDVPKDRTNANSIKGYFLNVDITSNVEAMGPFDKNTGLTGWTVYIACSTLYYTKIMQNRAANSEYAPVFDQTNGILDFTNPVYMLGKEDREKLLNFKAPVNFLVYNQRLNVYYLNDNWTHQPEHNVVSEEQNRRIVNRINKDLNKLMQKFKGRFNTVSTRSDVVSQITLYFQRYIMPQNYTIVEFNVICNESNNTADIITSNHLAVKVQVRCNNAVKYIDVINDVYPIGVDFEG